MSFDGNFRVVLCQNCVTRALKPRSNTIAYRHTLTHIEVAEGVELELRRGVLCVSTRRESISKRAPSTARPSHV